MRGTTATSQQTVTVTGTAIARRSDSESGSISRILAAAASIAVAITIIVVGRKFIRRFSGSSAAYPDIPHTRTTDIFPDEAEDMPYLSSQGYEAPTSQSQPPPVSGRQAIALLEDTTGKQWMIYQGENTIGRHGSNTVQIHDESVSRYHAKITVNGGHCHFEDWQASHPSEINGRLLESNKRYELKSSDRIRVGSSLLSFKWL